jgi:hypothetical protein
MATYIPGITDYIPQIQPFVPDYNFYSAALDFKQGKSDAARTQLSNIYGSLLNAPLTRDDNTDSRDKFFKTIDQDIQRMAGLDLSLDQNVDAAKDVFNQMLDNNNIVKDMVWTKTFNNEMVRRDGFKNCVDPEKCGGAWWEGGDRYMQYKREAFKNADAEQAMNMGMPEYVAYQDVTKRAIDLAKDAGLSITQDQDTGKWITTTKNGPSLIGPLQNLFMGSIGKDPKVMEYYRAAAEVDRLDWMYTNQQQYGSLEGAEQAYIAEKTPLMEKMFPEVEAEIEDNLKTTQSKKDKLNKKIDNSTPRQRTRLEELRDEFQNIEDGYSSSLDVVKDANGEIEVAQRNQKYSSSQIDRTLAHLGLMSDIEGAATVLAYKDAEYSIKENPYTMEGVKHKNRMLMERMRHSNAMKLATHQGEIKLALQHINSVGGPEGNTPTMVTDIPGATAAGTAAETSYELQNRSFNQLAGMREGVRADQSFGEKAIVGEVYNRARKEASLNGDHQAKEDVVAIAEGYLAAMDESIEGVGASKGQSATVDIPEVENASELAEMRHKLLSARTLQQKYDIVKNMELNPDAVAGSQIDRLYESTVRNMLNPNAQGTAGLRDYLESTRERTLPMRHNIAAKEEILEQVDEWFATESKDVADIARGKERYGDKWADAFEAYIDNKGHVRDVGGFISEMQKKGYDGEMAREMYRGDKRLPWNDKEKWFDGTYNTVTSGVDAIATTTLGVLDTLWDIWSLVPTGIHNIFTSDENDWNYFEGEFFDKGWDYDSRTDVANWGEIGAEEDKNISGYGDPGLHDMYKRAFSEFATPDGDRAWLQITGAGGWAAMGQQYDIADPAAIRSVATQGLIGILKDGMASSEAIYDVGGFSSSIPDNNETIEAFADMFYKSMIMEKKGKGRPLPTITYSDIAGGTSNMVGINIKLNYDYAKRFKGGVNTPTDYTPYLDELVKDGMTIYIPRVNADNIFTRGASTSAVEKLMQITGKVDMDYHPDYTKDFNIRSDPNTGNYIASGMMMTGLKEDGSGLPEWDYFENHHSFSEDLNQMVAKYDALLGMVKDQNTAIEAKWLLDNIKGLQHGG